MVQLGAINVAPSTTRWYVCGQSTGTGERLPADEMRLPYPTATIRGAISLPMVDIVGDPGIGKSRSLHEFVRRHSADPIMMLRGNCSGHGQETPFAAKVRAKLALAIAQRLSDISREGLHAVGPNVLLDIFLAVMRSKRPCRRGSGIGYHVERNRRHFYLWSTRFFQHPIGAAGWFEGLRRRCSSWRLSSERLTSRIPRANRSEDNADEARNSQHENRRKAR